MELPLRLKWLGAETRDICAAIAPYHPLIHISPAPPCVQALPGLTLLPDRVSRVLDLRDAPPAAKPDGSLEAGENHGFVFEVTGLKYAVEELSAIYDFYFDVYLNDVSLSYSGRHVLYNYAERLHQDLLSRRFVAFARVLSGRQVVAGCLLRRLSGAGLYGHERRPDGGCHLSEDNTVGLALLSTHPHFKSLGLDRPLLAAAAEWARHEGYSFLLAAVEPGLVVEADKEDASWLFGLPSALILHRDVGSLLYCDLKRCSYLARDLYYYSCDGAEPCLHYIANVSPGTSQAIPFLKSVVGIRIVAHTRHAEARQVLSQMNVECESLN